MNGAREAVTVLFAEDDPDDQMLVKEAFEEVSPDCDLRFVDDGVELMEYLHREGKHENEAQSPQPSLILLDLNMPRKDGREAARDIRADPKLRQIPIVVLTTSKSREDVHLSYELGVNSFAVKPSTYDSLLDLIRELSWYWLQVVELPGEQTVDRPRALLESP